MYIYLPIAEQPINAFIVLGIGWLVGIIMGMVGIGGGFLLTPLMIFFGIPSPVAVASVANQLVAPSVSGVLSHWKSGNVDFKMGTILLVGGVIGSSIGVLIFNILNAIGQLDLVIKLGIELNNECLFSFKQSKAPAFTNPSNCSLFISFGLTLFKKSLIDLNLPFFVLSLTIFETAS